MSKEQRQTDKTPAFRLSSRWTFGLGVCIVLVIVFWEFVGRVLKDVLSNFIPLVTTPVILESTLALVGISVVIVWNHYRSKKEDVDEWVVLPEDEDGKE